MNHLKEKRVLPLVISVLLMTGLLMCSCGRSAVEPSAGASAREQTYSFPEAGFRAQFPDEPVSGEGDGVYNEVEMVYMGSSYVDLTIVFYGDAPEVLTDFIASGPSDEAIKESLDVNLPLMVSDFIVNMDIAGVDSDLMEYRNYGSISPYSGMVSFSGRIDLSEYGGSSNQEVGICCALVCGDGKVYSVYELRGTIAEAVAAAESFTLIERTSEESAPSEAASAGDELPDAVPWSQAATRVGETVTVCGPIVGAEWASGSNGQPTFLDMGAAYPDESRLSIVIWGEDRSNFPEPPEDMYEGQSVAVEGEVYVYEGVCHVKVTSPSQITVL